MFHLLLPGSILALVGGAWVSQRKRNAEKPPEVAAQHRYVYDQLINGSYTAEQYRNASMAFSQMGYTAESVMLEKRAQLKEAPKELTEARRKAFAEAMEKWTDVEKLREFATKFDEIGATGAAENLRKRATEIEQNSEPGDSRPVTSEAAE